MAETPTSLPRGADHQFQLPKQSTSGLNLKSQYPLKITTTPKLGHVLQYMSGTLIKIPLFWSRRVNKHFFEAPERVVQKSALTK